jgi:hypothetical protein
MVYKYTATLPKYKSFLREYDIKKETKLYKLHTFLQNDLGFSPDQMALFRGVDKDGVVLRKYGLFDLGDGSMDTVTLEDTLKRGEVSLQYVYNIQMNLYIVLTFVSEERLVIKESYPRLMVEKGPNPDQFSASYEDFGGFSSDDEDGDFEDDQELYDDGTDSDEY